MSRSLPSVPPGPAPKRTPADLTDDELDAYVRARLEMAGVDLSVLPADDPDAPADRARIMESARRFLRGTPAAILEWEPSVQDVPPVMYPAELSGRADLPAEGSPDASGTREG